MASITTSTLKLVIDKGPRSGETLEFNSRVTIRLGRVVRGNNVTVKDPGISSKHLSIEFNSDIGKWVITDLESSNGTILNSIQLKPLSPFEISDGDVIKVGELTSIRVGIVGIGDGNNNLRNDNRQGGEIGRNLRVEGENGLDLEEEVRVRVRVSEGNDGGKGDELEKENRNGGGRGRGRGRGQGRGRGKKVSVVEETKGESKGNEGNVEDVKGKVEHGVSTRRTRSSRREVEEFVSLDVGMPVRRTRRMMNVEDAAVKKVEEGSELGVGDDGEAENVGVVESKRTRGGRGRKKKVDINEELNGVKDVLRDETNDLSKMGGFQGDREQPCAEPVGESGTTQQNELEDKMNGDLLGINVPELVQGSLYGREQPCADVMNDTTKAVGSLSVNEQPCTELLNETGQRDGLNDEANSHMLEVEVPENGGESKGNDGNVKGKMEHGVSTRRTRSSRREVEELVSLDAGMPFRSRSSKNVEDVIVRMVEESKFDVGDAREVETVGVVENKRTRGGRGRKQKVDVMEELDGIKDVLRDETGRDLLNMAGSEMAESREQPCEGAVGDAAQQNMVGEKVSIDVSGAAFPEQSGGSLSDREQCSVEPMDATTQQNKLEGKMKEGLSDTNVLEQVEGSLYAREQPCAEPLYDTVQCDKLEDTMNGDMLVEVVAEAGGSLSVNKQPSSEPFNKIDQPIEQNDKANSNPVEVEVPAHVGASLCAQPIDDTTPQDEIMVGASNVEKATPDKLESDLASEDQIMEECESEEMLEETGTSYHGGKEDRESVHAPDLEKMTLGEWFDYLEAYLPKQIYAVTDEIIDDMRKRAKQFDEFMLEQQKKKGKLHMAT